MKPKKIIRTIGNILGYLIVLAIAATTVFVMVSNMRGDIAFFGGYAVAWVKTESMEPQIPARSYILVKKTAADEVSVGDVIVFRSDDPVLGGAYNTHRVVKIIGEHAEFVTRGDNNLGDDIYTAKAGNVAGVVKAGMPVLTAFGRFFSTEIGLVISITAIFVIMMAMYLPDMIRVTRERTAEIEQRRRQQIDLLVKAEVERMKQSDALRDADKDNKTE